ncbi:MAG: ATP-dependent Clp protease adaptor ClpS [Alphaproteobacteria bacterium]|nr:ATP-dependent Clp protease adaptor ClpS [Alphaproteobacteria bacterium]
MQDKMTSSTPSKKTMSAAKTKQQPVSQTVDTLQQSKQRPSMYHIVLVVKTKPSVSAVKQILQSFFHLDLKRASQLSQDLLDNGTVICGSFTREVAENKVAEVREFSKQHHNIFDCVIRKEGAYAFKKPRA